MRFKLLLTEEEVKQIIAWHNKNSEFVVLDTETTGLNPHTAELVDIQLSGDDTCDAVMFPGSHVGLLAELRCPLVLHNFKYDYIVCYRHGWDMLQNNQIYDTMIMSHLVNENRESHSLDSWVQELFNDTYKTKFWGEYKSYTDAPLDRRLDYACRDVVYTKALFTQLAETCKKENLVDLGRRVSGFAQRLGTTTRRGLRVDLPYLAELGARTTATINELRPTIRGLVDVETSCIEMELWEKELDKRKTEKGKAGVKKPEFNFDSSTQLRVLLYDHLGLPVCYNEKTKKPSVDDAALEQLGAKHPVIPILQKYRGLKKVQGSFIDGTTERLVDDRIYPEFNINGTVTGRISSSNPNMQQLPREGGIRGMYIPDPDYVFISADYGQLEVCLAAHFSQDKNLLKIVLEGASQHDITAESLKIPRQQAKTLNFAMQYRCSHFKVAKILGISEADAKAVWYKYWETYSGLKRLMDDCDKKVDAGEPIINPFGRRRRFPVAKRNPWDPAYRQAFNALIQGTGADLTNFSFTAADRELREGNIGNGLFVVHDEGIYQTKRGLDNKARDMIVSNMVKIGQEVGLTVPLKVDCSEGMDRWLD